MLQKVQFVFFSCMWITLVYLLINHPKTYFLQFISVILPCQMLFRHLFFFTYSRVEIFFLTDFCYWGGYCLVYWINKNSTDEEMFRVLYVLGNGTLGISMYVFGNRFVLNFHDTMAAYAVHCYPMLVTLLVRWYIIPAEASLPPEERVFCTITDEGILSWHFLKTMFLNNMKMYAIWAVFYVITNFIIFPDFIVRN